MYGYSDHTEGYLNPIAATALNTSVYEKHFTLDRTLPGPDHNASLEPHELKKMVDSNCEVLLDIKATELTLRKLIVTLNKIKYVLK